MAACNVKPSISNILRKNRGLWTVYCREHSLGKQGRIQEFSIGEWGGGPNFGWEIDCETVRISSPYLLFKYARAVDKKVWNEAENRERDCFFSRAGEARELRTRKTLTSRFTYFFTDFEKKNRRFCSLGQKGLLNFFWQITCLVLWQKCNACVIEHLGS